MGRLKTRHGRDDVAAKDFQGRDVFDIAHVEDGMLDADGGLGAVKALMARGHELAPQFFVTRNVVKGFTEGPEGLRPLFTRRIGDFGQRCHEPVGDLSLFEDVSFEVDGSLRSSDGLQLGLVHPVVEGSPLSGQLEVRSRIVAARRHQERVQEAGAERRRERAPKMAAGRPRPEWVLSISMSGQARS